MEYRIEKMSGFKVLGKVEREIIGNVKANLFWKQSGEDFPTSDYEPAEYQMEVYPCGDGDYPDAISEVWIAVHTKSDL